MGFFNNFPYANFHELNLDWILSEVKKLRQMIEEYTAVNKVRYGGLWDIRKQYSMWSVVSDNNASYMSLKNVPAGVEIDNEEYWLKLVEVDPVISQITTKNIEQDARLDSQEKDISKLKDDVSEAENKVNNLWSWYNGKKIIIFGDSITDKNSSLQTHPTWAELMETIPGCDVVIDAVSGRKMTDLPNVVGAHTAEYFNNTDVVVIFLGINDFENNISLGDYHDSGTFNNAIRDSFEQINNKFGSNRKPEIIFITPMPMNKAVNNDGLPLTFYQAAIVGFCKKWGCRWVNGYDIPCTSEYYLNSNFIDNLHPNSKMEKTMFNYLSHVIPSGCGDSVNIANTVDLLSFCLEGVTRCEAYMDGTELVIVVEADMTAGSGSIITISNTLPFSVVPYRGKAPYENGVAFGGGNSLNLLVFYENGLKVNGSFVSGTRYRIDFEYRVKPKWCNIYRNK